MRTRSTLIIVGLAAAAVMAAGCTIPMDAPEQVAATAPLKHPPKPAHKSSAAARPTVATPTPAAPSTTDTSAPMETNPFATDSSVAPVPATPTAGTTPSAATPSAGLPPSVTADQGDPSGRPCTTLLGDAGQYIWSSTENVWVCSSPN